MQDIHRLFRLLEGEERVYIQTHDFPDPDSVACAFGLQHLLAGRGIHASLIYEGSIHQTSVQQLIRELAIPFYPASDLSIRSSDKIVIVDGCKGNLNVTDLIGVEVGVIDHHQVSSPEEVPYIDIRENYGACATIIYSYYRELGMEIPPAQATALLVGLMVDTAMLTRGITQEDVEAYAGLFRRADISLVNSLIRNRIERGDLAYYRQALERVRIQDRFAFCYLPEGCDQNLLGIIGDFFLSLIEVTFVLLCARNGQRIDCSARSEDPCWNAALIVRDVLRDIGFGGGHHEMAGGMVTNPGLFNEGDLLARIERALKEAERKP